MSKTNTLQSTIDSRHERLLNILQRAANEWPGLTLQASYDDDDSPDITWIEPAHPSVIHINWKLWSAPPPEIHHLPAIIPTLDGRPLWRNATIFPGDQLLMQHGFDYVIEHEVGHAIYLIYGQDPSGPLHHLLNNGPCAAAWLSRHAWKRRDSRHELVAELHAISRYWDPHNFPTWPITHRLILAYDSALRQIKEKNLK